ncbi:MAG: hypothetical protein WBQ14_01110 [Gaiellaceae bacterium]
MQKTVALIRAVPSLLPWRKFVVAIGIGLTISALRLDILAETEGLGGGLSYWTSWTTRLILIVLIAACAGLLIANVIREEEGDRFLAGVSGFGAILLGFFLFIPVAIGFGHLSELALGPKFGVIGSALIVLGALPVRALFSRQRSREQRGLPLYLTWSLAIVGPALVIVSLWRETSANPITNTSGGQSLGIGATYPHYWTSVGLTGGHALGIFVLAVAIVAIAMVVGDIVLKAPALGSWALAASLLLVGLAIYYPWGYLVGFVNIAAISTGAGLAIEGGLLAAGAALAAVLAERGSVDLRGSGLSKLLVAGGIALAFGGTWANVSGGQGTSLWVDGTTAAFPLLLVAVSVGLVAVGLGFRSKWALPSAGVLGWLIAGYFATYVVEALPNDLGTLGPAAWLGLGGGALMGLSALVSLRSRAAWKRRVPKINLRRSIPWLATAIGSGIAIGALWLTTEASSGAKTSDTYWNSGGHHALGILMLVLAASTIAALLGLLITRLSVLASWAMGASLILLGVSFFIPVVEAFKHFGTLRSGAWLALAGSLIASVGAVALALPEQMHAGAESKEAGAKVSPRARPPLKGKKSRVPETRRAR